MLNGLGWIGIGPSDPEPAYKTVLIILMDGYGSCQKYRSVKL